MKRIVYVFVLCTLVYGGAYAQKSNVQNVKADKGLNFAILDAAAWDTDISSAFEKNPKYTSLYYLNGIDQGLESVAPYLFGEVGEVNDKDSFGAWLVSRYDDQHKALYLYSDNTLERLRRHLSGFTRAQTEDGKRIFFRFYDPAIASYMFPLLTVEQLATFFSRVDYIAYVDPRTDEEKVIGPSEEVKKYAQNNQLPVGQTIVISNKQMDEITKAMNAYNAIEPKPATANLTGRSVVGSLPLPEFDGKGKAPRVKVSIEVDKQGKVAKAEVVRQGGGITPSVVKRAAEAAALKAVFNADPKAPDVQVGNIIYRFDKLSK